MVSVGRLLISVIHNNLGLLILNVSSSKDNSTSIHLLQLTDTHLFAPKDGCLLGVNTAESFSAVVEDIINTHVEFDAILATGDISQDHSHESYVRFVEGIKPLKQRCYWLPGNHDYKPEMFSVLPTPQVVCEPHVVLNDHWQVIMLDSQVSGVPHGRLNHEQLALLDNALQQHPDKWSLIILHHHPVLAGSQWLDQHTLKDSQDFWDVVTRYDKVSGVLCGHIHQELDVMREGVRVLATPSTCVQFKPQSSQFCVDTRSPGWREIELCADGQIHTEVKRLTHGRFLPDYSASGY